MDNLAEKQEQGGEVQGLKSVLRQAKQKEPESKSKTPILQVDAETEELAKKVAEAISKMTENKNIFLRLSKQLIGLVAPLRNKLCQREYIASVKVPAGNQLLGVTWKKMWLKMSGEVEPQLINIFGKEKYNVYFDSKYEISFPSDKLTDLFCRLAPNGGISESDIAEGQQWFINFFKVKEVVVPTEMFARDSLFFDEQTKNSLELCGVKQYEPSITTR